MESINWNLAQVWNRVSKKENRPLRERDYLYASEIGYPMVDVFLKMKATIPTNPPNDRSLRKFLMGNIIEHIVKQILIASGVYKHDEKIINATPYEGCLSVHGRADFIAGGNVDYNESIAKLKELNLPDYLYNVGEGVIESFSGLNLKEKLLEIKSVSSFAFEKAEKNNAPIYNHTSQAYHYEKNGGIEAAIVYVSKDDAMCLQFDIDAEKAEPIYRDYIEKMSYYFNKNEQPPLAPLLVFDEALCKFSRNFGVEYSSYLTLLYGFQNPDEYRRAVSYVDSWNRVLDRYVKVMQGAKSASGKAIILTPQNKEVVNDITKAGYDIQLLAQQRIDAGYGASEDED